MAAVDALVVDLNNFSRYPTLSAGYLAAVMRAAGMGVRVFSPLSVGVEGVTREPPATAVGLATEMLNFGVALGGSATLRRARAWIGENRRSALSRQPGQVTAAFQSEIERRQPDVVLVSSYLMYKGLVTSLCRICLENGIPVLLGGPYFAQREVVDQWVTIPGVTALAAGEVELDLPAIVEFVVRGEDPSAFEGVLCASPGGSVRGSVRRPLKALDSLPFPDFSDFPWDRYPARIVPVLTGRGCGWGACSFCSDITSTAGRTHRSRDPLRVLDEIRHQYEQTGTTLFVFTDLKLNSDLEMWRTLCTKVQDVAPGARWIGSVHVGADGENGLSAAELRDAAEAGCVRLTTGLESGSQRMLDTMKKGTTLDRLSDFLHAASAAGISPRTTMIVGYPGEEPEDLRASTAFVLAHEVVVERIKLCAFSATVGTAIDRRLKAEGVPRRPDVAGVDYVLPGATRATYRRGLAGLLRAVHRVNRTALCEQAAVFEGVM